MIGGHIFDVDKYVCNDEDLTLPGEFKKVPVAKCIEELNCRERKPKQKRKNSESSGVKSEM